VLTRRALPLRPLASRVVVRRRMGALLATTVASVAVQGFFAPAPVQQVVVTALSGATLLLAFRAADVSPGLFSLAAGIVAAAVAVAIVRAATGDIGEGVARLTNAALCALGPPAVALGVIRHLRSVGRVELGAVSGVLSFYLLLGMFYAFVYGALAQFGSEPFFAGGQDPTVSHCLYFSFITLTTTGYGDFVARTDAGHTIAVFEALMGQIYLVTIVSVIVSNLRPARASQVNQRAD
jgi:ion channel